MASFPSVKDLGRILRRLRAVVRSALQRSGYIPDVPEETEHVPLAVVTSPARIFEDASIDWDDYKVDIRCISWILYSTTDTDVIYSTVWFAADS